MNPLWLTIPAAIIPSLLLLRWFRNSDLIPEPWLLIRKSFYRGIWIIFPVLLIAGILKQWQPQADILNHALFEAFMLAAIPEEIFKYLVLVFFCLRLPEFDEPMDGIVYGVAVSLGFATFENILYVMDGGIGVALMRALTAVPAHALTGAIMGYYIGFSLLTTKKTRYFILALAVPVLLHGAYDFPLMYLKNSSVVGTPSDESLSGWMPVLFLLVISIEWKLAIRYKKQLQEMQLIKMPRLNLNIGKSR